MRRLSNSKMDSREELSARWRQGAPVSQVRQLCGTRWTRLPVCGINGDRTFTRTFKTSSRSGPVTIQTMDGRQLSYILGVLVVATLAQSGNLECLVPGLWSASMLIVVCYFEWLSTQASLPCCGSCVVPLDVFPTSMGQTWNFSRLQLCTCSCFFVNLQKSSWICLLGLKNQQTLSQLECKQVEKLLSSYPQTSLSIIQMRKAFNWAGLAVNQYSLFCKLWAFLGHMLNVRVFL